MRKRLLFLSVLLGFTMLAYAQNYREVVYLKNGSIIKGVIIEQAPNASLKIKTPDGSIFAYQMDEVDKIVKEEVGEPLYARNGRTKEEAGSSSFAGNRMAKSPRYSGYRGFVELGGGAGVGDFGDGFFSFQTSQGYQFNPYFYLGAGIGIDYHFDWGTVFMPIFVNARVNFLYKAITPFFDTKIGYSPFDGKGFYFNPTLGVSFGLNGRTALNFGIGYSMQMADIYFYDYYYYDESREIIGGVSFRLGVEF